MDTEDKTLVIKSKSTNPALVKGKDRFCVKSAPVAKNVNKKCWSVGQVKEDTDTAKKRGAYVEKKFDTDATIYNTVITEAMLHPPNRTDQKSAPATNPVRNSKVIFRPRIPKETVERGTQDLDAIYNPDSIQYEKNNPDGQSLQNNQVPDSLLNSFVSRPSRNNSNQTRVPQFRQIDSAPVVPPKLNLNRPRPATGYTRTRQFNHVSKPELKPNQTTAEPPKLKFRSKALEQNYNDILTQKMTSLKKRQSSWPSSNQSEESFGNIVLNKDEIRINLSYFDHFGSRPGTLERNEDPETLVNVVPDKNTSLFQMFFDLLETTLTSYTSSAKQSNSNAKISIEDKEIKVTFPENADEGQDVRSNLSSKSNRKSYGIAKDNTANCANSDNACKAPSSVKMNPSIASKKVNYDEIAKVEVYQKKPKKNASFNFLMPSVTVKTTLPRVPYVNVDNMDSILQKSWKSNLKSRSYHYAQSQKLADAAKAQKYDKTFLPRYPSRQTKKRKNEKQTLLNLIKLELKKDMENYEEPQTLHDALVNIAKNKGYLRQQIRFEDTMTDARTERSREVECFRERQIFNFKEDKRRRRRQNKRIQPRSLPKKFSTEVFDITYADSMYPVDQPSVHSLTVNEYNHDIDRNQYIARLDILKDDADRSINLPPSKTTFETETIAEQLLDLQSSLDKHEPSSNLYESFEINTTAEQVSKLAAAENTSKRISEPLDLHITDSMHTYVSAVLDKHSTHFLENNSSRENSLSRSGTNSLNSLGDESDASNANNANRGKAASNLSSLSHLSSVLLQDLYGF